MVGFWLPKRSARALEERARSAKPCTRPPSTAARLCSAQRLCDQTVWYVVAWSLTKLPFLFQPLLPTKLSSAVAAANATKRATLAVARLKVAAFAKPNATATRFTGTITCYTDPATGLMAGVQLGSAPALCSTDGTLRSVTVPADGAVVGVIATVDPKTSLLGQLTLKIESPTASASIVTCGGIVGGVPVDALPKLTALSALRAGCAPLPATVGRRRALASGVAIDAATLTVTAVPLTAAAGAGGGASGPVTLLSNLVSTAAQLQSGTVGIAPGTPYAVSFTTAASPVTINTVVLPLAYTTAAGSCTVSIQATAGGVPTTNVDAAVTRPVTTLFSTATTLVYFDGLGAAVAASTQYAIVIGCDALIYWISDPAVPPPTTFSGSFTAGNLYQYQPQSSSWGTGNPVTIYGVQLKMTT